MYPLVRKSRVLSCICKSLFLSSHNIGYCQPGCKWESVVSAHRIWIFCETMEWLDRWYCIKCCHKLDDTQVGIIIRLRMPLIGTRVELWEDIIQNVMASYIPFLRMFSIDASNSGRTTGRSVYSPKENNLKWLWFQTTRQVILFLPAKGWILFEQTSYYWIFQTLTIYFEWFAC